MHNALFQDKPTAHRVLLGNVRRVVHARHDHEGNFVRFVVLRTQAEMAAAARQYLPAKVGIPTWFEVYPHNFAAPA